MTTTTDPTKFIKFQKIHEIWIFFILVMSAYSFTQKMSNFSMDLLEVHQQVHSDFRTNEMVTIYIYIYIYSCKKSLSLNYKDNYK